MNTPHPASPAGGSGLRLVLRETRATVGPSDEGGKAIYFTTFSGELQLHFPSYELIKNDSRIISFCFA